MRSNRAIPAFIAGVLAAFPTIVAAQDTPTPAPPGEQLPPVEVIQKQATPAPAAKKKSAAKKKQAPVSPAPQPPAAVSAPTTQNPNSVYGAAGSAGASQPRNVRGSDVGVTESSCSGKHTGRACRPGMWFRRGETLIKIGEGVCQRLPRNVRPAPSTGQPPPARD